MMIFYLFLFLTFYLKNNYAKNNDENSIKIINYSINHLFYHSIIQSNNDVLENINIYHEDDFLDQKFNFEETFNQTFNESTD